MFDSLDEQIKKDEDRGGSGSKDRMMRYVLYGVVAAVVCVALIYGVKFMN